MEHDMVASILRRSSKIARHKALATIYALSCFGELAKRREQKKKKSASSSGKRTKAKDEGRKTSVEEKDDRGDQEEDLEHEEVSSPHPDTSPPNEGVSSASATGTGTAGQSVSDWPPRLSLPEVNTIMLYLAHAPRFVFAVGEKGAVLRSADRCKTWRKLNAASPVTDMVPSDGTATSLTSSTTPQPATGSSSTQQVGGEVSDEPPPLTGEELDKILNLLPKGEEDNGSPTGGDDTGADGADEEDEEGAAVIRGTGARAVAALAAATRAESEAGSVLSDPKGHPDLFGVACSGDVVIVVGAAAYISISFNRGVSFVALPIAELSRKVSLRDVVFLSEQQALCYGGGTLLSIRIDAEKKEASVAVSKRFPSAIGLVTCLPLGAADGPGAAQCVVSTENALHFSNDSGVTFHTVAHGLGLIRSIVDLTAQYTDDEIGQLLKAANEKQQSQTKATAKKTERKRYSYGAATLFPSDDQQSREAQLSNLKAHFFPFEKRVGLRTLAVLGTNGPIVNYDFTALVSLRSVSVEEAMRGKEQPKGGEGAPGDKDIVLALETHISRLVHVPFVQSGSYDKVGLVVYRPPRPQGRPLPPMRWIRSTAEGICSSENDGSSFSDPVQAYTGALVRLDEATLLSCNLKKSVVKSEDNGKNWALSVVPSNIRVAALYSVAVMK